jgi:hypothetical protein
MILVLPVLVVLLLVLVLLLVVRSVVRKERQNAAGCSCKLLLRTTYSSY